MSQGALTDYQVIAASIIRSLSGARWTWPEVEVRELYPCPTGKLILRGTPVNSVVSVQSYQTGEDLDYTLFLGGRIELADPRRFQARGYDCAGVRDRVDVTYRYGSKPSAGVLKAIEVLAAEMKLSDEDSRECRIPDRVTSVNRQGTSWTLIDPQDFLDNGRTGITEVDMILKARGKVKARTRVFSPEYPPPQRISVTVVS